MKSILFSLLVVSLRFFSGPTSLIAYLLIAIYSLGSRRQIIESAFLCWFLTMVNAQVAPQVTNDFLGRYLVLLSISLSAIVHSHGMQGRLRTTTASTIALGMVFTVHSFVFSEMPDISTLKALSWTLAMASLCSAWSGLSPPDRKASEQYVFWGLVAIAGASIPLLGTTAGYSRNETGFQGVISHPQAFGATMGVLAAWACARLLLARRIDPKFLGIVFASSAFVVLSESRTAGLAVILGLPLAFMTLKALGRVSLIKELPLLRKSYFWLTSGLVIVLAVPFLSSISDFGGSFIRKSGRADVNSVFEAYDNSRGQLIEAMVENIAKYPLTGIGFGVASDPSSMDVQRDPVFGLAVGAPTEKGVVPLMLAEELGIPIALLSGIWIFGFVRRAANAGFVPLALMLVALLVNLGEAVMFSPGGQGLVIMLVLSMAATTVRSKLVT